MAQVSDPPVHGVSTAVSDFDPNDLRLLPRIPETGGYIEIIHPPTVPQSEYDFRTNVIRPRTATEAAPPGVAFTTQDVVPRDPLKGAPTVGFEGMFQSIFRPSSANAAAGPAEVIEIMNSQIARYAKDGTMIGTPVPLSTWFQDLFTTFCPSNVASNCPIADVQVRYDQIHGRFLASAQVRDAGTTASFFLLSVSKGATWDSGWRNWALNATIDGAATQTTNWADFPQIGFDDKAVYLTALMFNQQRVYQYSKVRLIKKTELYDPAATALHYVDLPKLKNEDDSLATTLQPFHTRGRVAVAPTGAFMINSSDVANATYFTLWEIDDPTSATPLLSRFTINGSLPYTFPAAAPQRGTTIKLDTGQASVLKAIYREGAIFTAMNAQLTGNPTAVLYTRFDAPTQSITLQAKTTNGNFFYPALDVPATLGPGNAVPPIIADTTTASDGSLTFPGISNVKPGEDFYDLGSNGVSTRWGDYSGGAVDPVTGGLWVSSQYAKARTSAVSAYSTWIAYFPWATTPRFDDVPSTSPFFDYVNTLALWGVTTGCSATTYCPTAPITRAQMATFIVRSIYGENFTSGQQPYFTDVPLNDPFFKYVQKLKELGITAGCSPTQFCPNATLTRLQAAVFIVRAKFKALFGDNFAYPASAPFADVPATDPAFPYVQKLSELGITTGCATVPVKLFCPSDPLTREQIAVFVVRGFLN